MFLGILILILFSLLEGISFLLYRLVIGTTFSYGQVESEQINVAAKEEFENLRKGLDEQARQLPQLNYMILHPYLGFVFASDHNPESFEKHHGSTTNALGFIDPQPNMGKRYWPRSWENTIRSREKRSISSISVWVHSSNPSS
jgi:hypothetical protein